MTPVWPAVGRAGVGESWDRRARRAEQLAAVESTSSPLLTFYACVLRSQKAIGEQFDRQPPNGLIDHDVALVSEAGSGLLVEVARHGPGPLAAQARTLLAGSQAARQNALHAFLDNRSDRDFFGKAVCQPYLQWLADAGVPSSRAPARADNRCPRCGGAPQLSVLSAAGASGDGSSRQLQCANCQTLWPFRRVMCPGCGEEDERTLGYFQSPALDHVRIDACDRCRRYLKSVDLGRLGLAVPLVDEVAAAPLDAWAFGHGYEKIELNLLGL
jgi:formate dehydrogenase maturation protein FdhE